MRITTKKGDSGYTSTLSGERVPKYHIVTEAVGTLDEASSLIGVARASSKEKRIKRILLQVQKQLVTVAAELSVPKGTDRPPKKTISETDVRWLEQLIDDLEEALALPPGFVTFGREPSGAQMNVARTAVRKAERTAVKMNSEGLIENPSILKYLNRLSDLVFLLACFEERDDSERRNIKRALLQGPVGGSFGTKSGPTRWLCFSGSYNCDHPHFDFSQAISGTVPEQVSRTHGGN